MAFEREERYLVLKREDIAKYLTADGQEQLNYICHVIAKSREVEGKQNHGYVVVSDDWPMYEATWDEVEAWVNQMDKGEPYLPAKFKVGEYIVIPLHSDKVWLQHEDGEGMELTTAAFNQLMKNAFKELF